MIAQSIKIYLLLVTLFSAYTLGQTSKVYFEVLVLDPVGDRISKAQVFLISNDNRTISKITNGDGVAIFNGIEEGRYILIIEATGFNKYENKIVEINKIKNNLYKVVLELETIQVETTINDQDLKKEDALGIKVLTEDDIKKLPDDPLLFERMIRNIAGESVTGGEMPITVDGFNDGIPPKEFIREIRFDRNIFSAQYDNPNGGGIQIFTKSDVKKFNFGIKFNFLDSKLNASDPYINKKLPARNLSPGGFIMGPIIPGKASFTLEYQRFNNKASSALNAVTLNSEFIPIILKDFVSRSSHTDYLRFTTKSDFLKKHSLYLSYSINNSQKSGNGVGGFNLLSRSFDNKSFLHDLRVSETFFVNQNFVNQIRFQTKITNNKNFGANDNISIIVRDAFSSGSSQIDDSILESVSSIHNDSIFIAGKHDFRFGLSVRQHYVKQKNKNDLRGTYVFAGRQAPQLDAQNKPILDLNGNFLNVSIDSLESYRRTVLFTSLGYSVAQIRTLGGGASQFSIANGIFLNRERLIDTAFYVQDNYSIFNNTQISLGLRYENQTDIKSNFNFAPRFGFLWSPKNEGKSPIASLPGVRFGFGVFYSRFGIYNLLNQARTNSRERTEFFTVQPSILDTFPNTPTVEVLKQSLLSKTSILVDEDVSPSVQSLFNLLLSKKITKTISLSFMFSNAFENNQLVTRNINAPLMNKDNFPNSESKIYPLGEEAGYRLKMFSSGKRRWQVFSFNLAVNKSFIIKRNFLKLNEPRVGYNFRRSSDNIVDGSGNPFDSYDFTKEFSKGIDDGLHRISASVGIETLLGLNINTYLAFQTGYRFNIITGVDTNGDGFFDERPGYATNLNKPNLIYTKYGILDPNPTDLINIIPRNLGRGNNSFNLDVSISKSFRIAYDKAKKDQRNYSMSVNLFIKNFTNTNNKAVPIGNMLSPNFLNSLTANNAGFTNISTSAGDFSGFSPRTLNFSVNFSF